VNFRLWFVGEAEQPAKELLIALARLADLMSVRFGVLLISLFIGAVAHAGPQPTPVYGWNSGFEPDPEHKTYYSLNATCLGILAYENKAQQSISLPYSVSYSFDGTTPIDESHWYCDFTQTLGAPYNVHVPFTINVGKRLVCASGEAPTNGTCGPDFDKNKGPPPPPPPACPCTKKGNPTTEGNPINPVVGNKYQEERDYTGNGPFPIVLERFYNSAGSGPGALMGFSPVFIAAPIPQPATWTPFNPPAGYGQGVPISPITSSAFSKPSVAVAMDNSWRLNYDRTLTTQSGSALTATVTRPDSKTRTFTWTNGAWVPDLGELVTSLTQQNDASGKLFDFTYVNENDEVEKYDASGKLLSITNRAGLVQTLHYAIDPNSFQTILTSITDAFGHQLTLSYDSTDRLSGAVDPNGGIYSYAYDGNGNLSTVTYPDGNSRQYVYENTTYPTALTGIIDENGGRFATWSYDANGNAYMSEHAGGVEEVTLTYPSATTSIATDAGGAVRTYTSQVVNGMVKAGAITETCGANCTRTRTMSYDTDGNVSSVSDFNGNVTNYVYDLTRDLETSRTEAYGTAQARTITTQWHPTFRLPLGVTEPGRTTMYTYDANGNQLTKTITAGGISRTWTYSYNEASQILSVIGPRTDVANVTTYTYDASGNLSAVKNTLGQMTTLSNYDLNGRVGLITGPSGVTTTLTYAPRGWLTNKVVSAGNIVQSTTYSYDNVGQLTKVTLPDGSSVGYIYDLAHRLTNITDSLGDSINYSLDLMGNRTGETVTDPNGVLTRQISRIYDSVNRLQKVTGGAQ
jgi:YD repeat-containing protein